MVILIRQEKLSQGTHSRNSKGVLKWQSIKITCTDPDWVGNRYNDIDFEAVGYTDSKEKADEFANSGYATGGVPLFTVEEVKE